ncbi:MAG: NUDIX hydrolase [Planctomycetales bacterium]|nr:NUDIX hydrolase [Planctomycetales bacterium]
MDLLATARELAAISQTGLHFTKDPYDQERYHRLGEIAAELLAVHADVSVETVHAWANEEFGYATPKIDVRALIVKSDEVLLIREEADDGRWTLPGGWADVNESPSEAVVREVEEETGYDVRPLRLLAVLDREKQGHQPPFPFHVYKLIFLCEITGGMARKTIESSESAYFAVDDLPELSQSRVLAGQIRELFQGIRDGSLETRFD